ncbi:hypothetical protein [Gryllotalpicola protaetiae]|uniref:hypothetical protein n=1 Tax=Gryllotalpicola protaetiae TaxID=2419771 RepID=UPI0013C48E27|nr:hypothetical protein [Gryllotalpicola protaetiae]
MDIVLTVTVSADGRLAGIAARADASAAPLAFSGNLELLATLERLCVADVPRSADA